MNRYDCLILNYCWSSNYGAVLTAYAMQETLRGLGLNPATAKYVPPHRLKSWKPSFSKVFGEKYLELSEKLCTTYADLKKLNDLTDTFVVGSDQVWRYKYNKDYENTYYLNFVDNGKRRVGLSASFGTDHFEGDAKATAYANYYLHHFDFISVREKDGVGLCRDTFGLEAVHLPDPVFLLEPHKWNNLISNSIRKDKGHIAAYVLDETPETGEAVAYLAEKTGKPVVNLRQKPHVSVEDWLYLLKNSDYVVTDSFHGTCFAILFNKPFICLANTDRGGSRFTSLFDTFPLGDRCVYAPQDAKNESFVNSPMRYDAINDLIQQVRENGKTLVTDALRTPVVQKRLPDRVLLEYLAAKTDDMGTRLAQVEKCVRLCDTREWAKEQIEWYSLIQKITFGATKTKYVAKIKKLKLYCKEMDALFGVKR